MTYSWQRSASYWRARSELLAAENERLRADAERLAGAGEALAIAEAQVRQGHEMGDPPDLIPTTTFAAANQAWGAALAAHRKLEKE